MDLQNTIETLLCAFASSPATPERVSEFRWKLMVAFTTSKMDYHRFSTMLKDQPIPTVSVAVKKRTAK